MGTVLTFAIVTAALLYIGAPLLLWINGSRMPPTQLERADPASTVPSRAEAHFWKSTHYFSSNGFERLGDRVRESARNGFAAYNQVWRHGETGEVALVATFVKDGDGAFCKTFVAFLHDRSNGAMLSTSNFDPGARTLLDPLGTAKLTVSLEDLAQLRELHQAHVSVHGAATVRPLRVRDGFTLCKQLDASTRAVALSQKRFRVVGDTLRITLWGAFYGIWINLPPLKWKYEWQERRLLEEVRLAGAASGVSTRGHQAA